MKRYLLVLAIFIMTFSLLSSCSSKPTFDEQYELGLRYLSERNYEEAIIAFTAAIEIDPKRPEAYIGAAEAYLGVGKIGEAVAIIKQGLVLLPDNIDLLAAIETLEASGTITRPATNEAQEDDESSQKNPDGDSFGIGAGNTSANPTNSINYNGKTFFTLCSSLFIEDEDGLKKVDLGCDYYIKGYLHLTGNWMYAFGSYDGIANDPEYLPSTSNIVRYNFFTGEWDCIYSFEERVTYQDMYLYDNFIFFALPKDSDSFSYYDIYRIDLLGDNITKLTSYQEAELLSYMTDIFITVKINPMLQIWIMV